MFKVLSLLTSNEQPLPPANAKVRDVRKTTERSRESKPPSSSSLMLIADVLAEFGDVIDTSSSLGANPLAELAANEPPRRPRAS
jgi:hypothetical protein